MPRLVGFLGKTGCRADERSYETEPVRRLIRLHKACQLPELAVPYHTRLLVEQSLLAPGQGQCFRDLLQLERPLAVQDGRCQVRRKKRRSQPQAHDFRVQLASGCQLFDRRISTTGQITQSAVRADDRVQELGAFSRGRLINGAIPRRFFVPRDVHRSVSL